MLEASVRAYLEIRRLKLEDRERYGNKTREMPRRVPINPRLYHRQYQVDGVNTITQLADALYHDKYDFPQAGRKLSLIDTAAAIADSTKGTSNMWKPSEDGKPQTSQREDDSLQVHFTAKMFRDALRVVRKFGASQQNMVSPIALNDLNTFLNEQIDMRDEIFAGMYESRAPQIEHVHGQDQVISEEVRREAHVKGLHRIWPFRVKRDDGDLLISYSLDGLVGWKHDRTKDEDPDGSAHIVTIRKQKGQHWPRVYGKNPSAKTEAQGKGPILIDGRGSVVDQVDVDGCQKVEIRNMDIHTVFVAAGEVDIEGANIDTIRTGKNGVATIADSSVQSMFALWEGSTLNCMNTPTGKVKLASGDLLSDESDFGVIIATSGAHISVNKGDVVSLAVDTQTKVSINGAVDYVCASDEGTEVGISDECGSITFQDKATGWIKKEDGTDWIYVSSAEAPFARSSSHVNTLAEDPLQISDEIPDLEFVRSQKRLGAVRKVLSNIQGMVVPASVLEALAFLASNKEDELTELAPGALPEIRAEGVDQIADIRDFELRAVLRTLKEYEQDPSLPSIDGNALRSFISEQRVYQLEKLSRLAEGMAPEKIEHTAEAIKEATREAKAKARQGGYKERRSQNADYSYHNNTIDTIHGFDPPVRSDNLTVFYGDLTVSHSVKDDPPIIYSVQKDGIRRYIIDGQGRTLPEISISGKKEHVIIELQSIDVGTLTVRSKNRVVATEANIDTVTIHEGGMLIANDGTIGNISAKGPSARVEIKNTDVSSVSLTDQASFVGRGSDIGTLHISKTAQGQHEGDIALAVLHDGGTLELDGEVGRILGKQDNDPMDHLSGEYGFIDPKKRIYQPTSKETAEMPDLSGPTFSEETTLVDWTWDDDGPDVNKTL